MRVPRSLLPHRLTVQPYAGRSSVGPTYGASTVVAARVELKRSRRRRPDGATVVGVAEAVVRHDAVVPVESKVTFDGRVYEVGDVAVAEGLRHPSHQVLVLVGPRSGS
jgi:hypothetical protein